MKTSVSRYHKTRCAASLTNRYALLKALKSSETGTPLPHDPLDFKNSELTQIPTTSILRVENYQLDIALDKCINSSSH